MENNRIIIKNGVLFEPFIIIKDKNKIGCTIVLPSIPSRLKQPLLLYVRGRAIDGTIELVCSLGRNVNKSTAAAVAATTTNTSRIVKHIVSRMIKCGLSR
jgi:hypothetical protein